MVFNGKEVLSIFFYATMKQNMSETNRMISKSRKFKEFPIQKIS